MKKMTCTVIALGLAIAGCGGDDPVSPTNRAPVIAAGPSAAPAAIFVDETALLAVTATDADGDNLTYAWSAADGTITGSGALVVYHPVATAVQAIRTVTVVVSDGNGGTATKSVDVTINPTVLSSICEQIDGTLNIHWELLSTDSGLPVGCTGIEITDGTMLDAADGTVTMSGTSVTNGVCIGTAAYTFTVSADGMMLTGADTANSVDMVLTRNRGDGCFAGTWTLGNDVYRAHIAVGPFQQ